MTPPALAVLGLALATATAAMDAPAPPPAVSDAGFCVRAQQLVAATSRVATNLVFTQPEGFVKSKPRVRPLEVDQYVAYADAAHREPVRVSCKLKSADHLRAEYGPAAAGPERDCRAVNRDTAARVYGSLATEERARLAVPADRLVLAEDEQALTGAAFTRGTDTVRLDADGRLVVQALAIRVDWEDWRWAWMPDRFRGQHSCHFIAPEYLRRLVTGEVEPPAEP